MNKSDLIAVLAEKEGVKAQEAFDNVNMMFDEFSKTVRFEANK